MDACVAVFDVGKTNKKVLIFNRDLALVDSRYHSFPADESGPEHREQTAAVGDWFLHNLRDLAVRHHIGAIAISTHGATYVGVDHQGLSLPAVAYTTNPGAEFSTRFFAALGSTAQEAYTRYATPDMGGLVNAGKLWFYLRERYPALWARTQYLLGYPSYFAWLLTGVAGNEPTMAGCHSYLWDHAHGTWSPVIDALGAREKLPPVQPSGAVLGRVSAAIAQRCGLPASCVVVHGVHDSNASLVPYLLAAQGDFALNSTGTWCVAMRPSTQAQVTTEQQAMGLFYNVSVFGQPVATTAFMGGNERDIWSKLLAERSGGTPTLADAGLLERTLNEAKLFVLPGVMPGTGPFPHSQSRLVFGQQSWTLAALQSGADCPLLKQTAAVEAALTAGLAVQSALALRAVGTQAGTQVFTEGGFRKGRLYNRLLSALLPGSPCLLSDLSEATATGAALLGLAALEGVDPRHLASRVPLRTEAVEPLALPGLSAYADRFARLAASTPTAC